MPWIVTADLHLDDKPQHAYRWGIFDWLAKQQEKYGKAGCLILGDITDEKDCHSASLVNRMVLGMKRLIPPVYVLKGNHDFIDKNNPFFGFLSQIEGVTFITEPMAIDAKTYAIPYQPDQGSFNKACEEIPLGCPVVLLHGLFEGAMSESGQCLPGLQTAALEARKPDLVLAGDVHKPQQVGCVTYCGAPYRVRFGEDYTPRALLLAVYGLKDLHYPCPQKHSLILHAADELAKAGLKRGDQVKLTIRLEREETVNWAKHRQRVLDACKDLGVEVFGVDLKLPEVKKTATPVIRAVDPPKEVLKSFCLAEGLEADIKKVGLALLNV